MDKETAQYIITYFSHLLTSDESMAITYSSSIFKNGYSPSVNTKTIERIYKQRGWLTSEQSILDLLIGGYENFELLVANRILSQNPDKVIFNTCPKCNKLARTPYAKQCRHCLHQWHHISVARFKLNNSFQITGRCFFLLGEIVQGEIKEGQLMDLTILGLHKKPKIESIEFARKHENGKVWEEIGLGTNELTEEDKAYLQHIGSFETPFDIIIER